MPEVAARDRKLAALPEDRRRLMQREVMAAPRSGTRDPSTHPQHGDDRRAVFDIMRALEPAGRSVLSAGCCAPPHPPSDIMAGD